MEEKVEKLKASLLEAEQELSDENCHLDHRSIEYDDSLSKSSEIAHLVFGDLQGIIQIQVKIYGVTDKYLDTLLTTDDHAIYVKESHRLDQNLDRTLSNLRDQLPNNDAHNTDDIDAFLARYVRLGV